MRRARRTSAAAVLAAALVVAGCGDDPDTSVGDDVSAPTETETETVRVTETPDPSVSVSPSPYPSVSVSPSPYPTRSETPGAGDEVDEEAPEDDGLPFTADTSTDTREASADAALTVTDVRIGRHDGFDRVVFELAGQGTPGWRVAYTDDPTQQGSGHPVEVAGDATLHVQIQGTTYPFDTDEERYDGPNPYAVRSTELVTETLLGSVYEGITEAFIGVTDEVPFRAYLFEDPVRVVVEVAQR